MESILQWWDGLSGLNRGFYISAIFCSLVFLWQFIAGFSGFFLHGPESVHVDIGDGHCHDFSSKEIASFKILTFTTILAFCTMFSWSFALYLNSGLDIGESLGYSVLWGGAGFGTVAGLLWLFQRLQEIPSKYFEEAIGQEATVYLDIPENGIGLIRVRIRGSISFVKAKSMSGERIPVGATVLVCDIAEPGVLQVIQVSGQTLLEKKGGEDD